ncbi:MAG: hypothetical protein KBD21_03730 [Candidatus Pacebacteria bacterium]|nr:hypothetical protein [Candidatus Paceibacterota bacterium]
MYKHTTPTNTHFAIPRTTAPKEAVVRGARTHTYYAVVETASAGVSVVSGTSTTGVSTAGATAPVFVSSILVAGYAGAISLANTCASCNHVMRTDIFDTHDTLAFHDA